MARAAITDPADYTKENVKTNYHTNLANTEANFVELYGEVQDTTYNLADGLRNWRKSLGRCNKNSAGVGGGGVGILWCGSSTMEGMVATSPIDTGAHQLKRLLQAHFNPYGVQGGYGFVPTHVLANMGAGLSAVGWDGSQYASSGFYWLGTPAGACGAYGAGTGAARLGYAVIGPQAAAETHFHILLDGTHASAIPFRFNADKVQFVIRETTSSGFTYDVKDTAPITIGTGSPTGTVANGSGTTYSKHLPAAGISITRTAKNYIQIAPGVGNTVRMDGIIAYDGDWDCGVRFHNLAATGTVSSMWADANNIAGMQNYGTASGSGAVHAKLAVSNLGQNDINASVPVATFKTNYATWIQAMLAMPSLPSVMLIVPCPMGGRIDSYYSTDWPAYVAAIYELADTYGCAIVDLNKLFPTVTKSPWDPTGASPLSALGWDGDGAQHYTDIFYRFQADLMFRILATGGL